MDILLTGGTGQVGSALRRLVWPSEVRLHAPERSRLDLANPVSVAAAMAERPWAAVLSVGAYTAVDRAESDVAAAWAANALAPAILSRLAADAGIPIVHVSTDYVFAGDSPRPYVETDPVGPRNVYGASKEGGEQAIRTGNPRHAVIRTAWVLSPERTNFARTMLRLASERDEVAVVSDQRGSPTIAGDLATIVQAVALRLIADPEAPAGTFHAANAGDASWADLAEAIFAASERCGGPTARVVRIATADYPTAAPRPVNSRLSTAKLRDAFGLELRPWQDGLDEIVSALVRVSGATVRA